MYNRNNVSMKDCTGGITEIFAEISHKSTETLSWNTNMHHSTSVFWDQIKIIS